MYSARSGYEIVNEIGVEPIRAKSQRQTQTLIDLADQAGLLVRSPRDPATRGGTIILDIPNGREVTAELGRRQILVDYRPGAGIRIAPHFYTTDEEIAHTIAQIVSIVKEKRLV
jgi:kynureninase